MRQLTWIFIVVAGYGALTHAAESQKTSGFWEFVDQAVKNHPELAGTSASVRENSAQLQLLSWMDDPTIEMAQTERNTPGQYSTVQSLALRQKLPFWTSRTRQKGAQSEFLEAAKYQHIETQQKIENEIVIKFYLYARAREEQRHLIERRKRLSIIKDALARTKVASPTQRVERQLISSAIALAEEQFDTIDTEVNKLRIELESVGLRENAAVSANWISLSRFKEFLADFKSRTVRENPTLEHKRSLYKASEQQLNAMKPRPEFDLFLQGDRERGGTQEKNMTAGLAIKLPMDSLIGPRQRIGEAEKARTRAALDVQERVTNLEWSGLRQEFELAEKSLRRFDYFKIHELELAVDRAEKETRQGWVPVSALLEMERQMHAQIEATFDAQMRAVSLIKRSCLLRQCDARVFLGGTL